MGGEEVAVVLVSLVEKLSAAVKKLEDAGALKAKQSSYTLPEAAERLGFGISKMKNLLHSGEIKSVRIGKTRMVTEEEIRRVTSRQTEMVAPSAVAKKTHARDLKREATATRAALKKTAL